MMEYETLRTGILLIANAELQDPNFRRTVVLLCEHNNSGTFGLILNRPLSLDMMSVVDDYIGENLPLYWGGPVQQNMIHVLHRYGELVSDCTAVADGVYWGGDYEQIKSLLDTRQVDPKGFKFFLGYSGWGEGQLDDEMQGHSWYLFPGDAHTVFEEDAERMWSRILRRKGGDYAIVAMFPQDPQLN
jgi:putative transcriptional regulator